MTTRKAQIDATMDASGVVVGADVAKKSLKGLAESAKESGRDIGGSLDDASKKTGTAAAKIEADTKRAADSIQRTIAQLEASGKGKAAYFEQLFSMRGVDTNALRPLLDQLAEVEARQKKATIAATGFAGGTDAAAKSAAQLSYQLRQVGPQFTDIVTSLASGQAPLTVLIQQGGQLKDVFGGIGPAARALGGYLLSLINPYTVVAAAAAALGLAYVKGAGEAEAYNKSLILTGNSAGVTAGQLGDMAKRISAVSGTQSQAAAALAEMASSTRIGSQNLESFSRVAVQLEKTIGQPIAETRKQFEELGKAPVDASRKLNEATNYLTGALYSQIRALEDQGRATDAAELAQRSYAQAMLSRTKDLESNLGLVEKAWKGITGAAKSAWDAMLNVGRQVNPGDALKAAEDRLTQLQNAASGTGANRFLPGRASRGNQAAIDDQQGVVDALRETVRLQERSATLQGERARLNDAEIKWADLIRKSETDSVKQAREINAIRTQGLAARKSEAEIERAIADYREKNAKKGATDTSAARDAEAQRRAVAEALGVSSDYVETLGRLERARANETLTVEAYTKAILDLIAKQSSSKEIAKAQEEAQKALEKAQKERLETAKKINAIEAQALNTGQQTIASLEAEVEKQRQANEEIGLTTAALDRLRIARIGDQIEQAESTLIAAKSNEIGADRIAQMEREVELLRERRNLLSQGNIRRDIAEAEKAMGESAKKAVEDWQKASDQISQGLTDSLFRAAESGKSAFETLRDSIRGMFNNLVLKPVIQAGVNTVVDTAAEALGVKDPKTGNSIGSTLSSISSVVSAASKISSLYTSIFGGASLAGIGAGITAAGGLTAGGLTAGAGAGSILGLGGSAAAGGLTAGAGAGAILGGGTALTGAGAVASGAGAAGGLGAAAAIPYIGWAVAALGVLTQFIGGDRGGPKQEGFASTDPNAERIFTGNSADFQAGVTLGSIVSATNLIAGRFGGAFTGTASLGFDMDPAGKADSRIASIVRDATGAALLDNSSARSVGRDPKEFDTQIQLETKRMILAALQGSNLEDGFGDIFKRLNPAEASPEAIDALFALADQLKNLGDAAARLPGVIGTIADLSAVAREELIGLAGGFDSLTTGLRLYYENFFSAEEQLANSGNNLRTDLAAIGLSFDALAADSDGPRQAFRDLFEGLDLTTVGGRQSAAALLALVPAVDSWIDSIDAARESARQAAASIDNAFLSESDRFLQTFDRLGLAIPRTTAEFQELVRAQDTTTEEGRSLIATLLAVYGGFKAVDQSARDAANALIRNALETSRAAVSGEMDALVRANGDFAQSLFELENPIQTTADRFIELGQTMQDMLDRMASILGTGAVSLLDQLQAAVSNRSGIASARAGVAGTIEGLQIQGFQNRGDLSGGIAFLRNLERAAFAELQTTSDPAGVAGKITNLITQRYQLEAQLISGAGDARQTSLRDEIATLEQMASIADQLKSTILDLQTGSLSALAPQDQVAIASAAYGDTLSRARAGDVKALQDLPGAATQFLTEQQSFDASGGNYGATFTGVLADLQSVGASLSGVPTQLSLAQAQLTSTGLVVDNTDAMAADLQSIDTALTVRSEAQEAGIDALVVAIRAQITGMDGEREALRGQWGREADRWTALGVTLAGIEDSIRTLAENATLAAAA